MCQEVYTKKMLQDTLRAFENMKKRGEFVEICNKHIPKLKRKLKKYER